MWQKKLDKKSPVYKQYADLLARIKSNNKLVNIQQMHFHILLFDQQNPAKILLGIQEADTQRNKFKPGQLYVFYQARIFPLTSLIKSKTETLHIDRPQSIYIKDRWGAWLIAHIPIYNSANKVVGAVAVDVNANDVVTEFKHMIVVGCLSLVISFCLASMLAYSLARHFSKPLEIISRALSKIGHGDFSTRINIVSNDEIGDVEKAVNEMAVGLQQRDNLKQSLAHYVSSHVAENIIQTGQLPVVQGERRKVTVLFYDIRNFTSFAEKLPPEDVVNFLNTLFKIVVDIIFKYKGTVDKFLGDGLMAMFGAPIEDELQEEHAIHAAIEIQRTLKKQVEYWQNKYGVFFKIGIGINTGTVIVGNIGSEERMDYTAIGDSVNLAARLETANKELGTEILISENTHMAVSDKFNFRPMGQFHAKGREESVLIYEVKS